MTTAATSYTPFTTYPADTTLYWRVRADDENLIGLTWSAIRTFQRTLPTPTPSSSNATSGDFTPPWSWSNVTGASGYTFSMDGPTGQHQEWASLKMPAAAFVYLFGPGVWRWRVRAEFPKTSGFVTGPWSSYVPFTRTLSEPSGSRTSAGGNHVLLSWNWKLGAKDYRVQISQRPDFSTTIEDVTTDNTSYAPVLTHPFYINGGSFYWRVAARDKAFNNGDWTQVQRIDIAEHLQGGGQQAGDPQALDAGRRHRLRSAAQGRRRREGSGLGRGYQGEGRPDESFGQGLVPAAPAQEGPACLQRLQGGLCRRRAVDARLVDRP